VAGICSTVIAPKRFKSGSEGFTYTVSDLDGESAPSVVAVTVAPMSAAGISASKFLKPISKSQTYVSFAESASSVATGTTFNIPLGTSYFTSNLSIKSIATPVGTSYIPTAKGKITNCLGMNGSSADDTSCTYTPNDGDEPKTPLPQVATATPAAASLTIGGALKFDALKAGTDGNDIKVYYKDISSTLTTIDSLSTAEQKFAYTGTLDEVYVRVDGNNIYVFFQDGISTFKQIKDALAADSLVNSLVNITLLVPDTLTVSVAPALNGLALTGGTTSFDSFAYTISDLYGTSTNTSSIVFRVTPTEDPPVWNYVANTSITKNEDFGSITIDLSTTYTDVENNVDYCELDSANSAVFLNYFTYNSCTCVANACSIVVTPNANVASIASITGTQPFTFYYKVRSGAGASAVYPTPIQSRAYNITLNPINDKPTLPVIAAATMNENSSNAPAASSTNVLVDAGGGVFESDQTLSLTVTPATTSSTNVGVTLIPNQPCANYTAKAGTPVANSFVPTSAGEYYFDYTNKICYVSKTISGTATYTSSDWEYYPSITAFPNCGATSGTPYVASIDYSGKGIPSGIPSTPANKHYLDTKNNVCYISTGTTWKKDNTLLSYSIAYVPTKNQSGVATISVTLTDSGTNDTPYVNSFSNVNNDSKSFTLTINAVNDPPYFIAAPTKVETNEGGTIQTDGFMVDEDEGSTLDEDANDIWITEVKSDNQAVLPDSAISFFYDLNDNGIEESNESRVANASNLATSRFEAASGAGADANVALHKFYFKLKPVAGITGNSNITFKLTDGTNTVSKSFSLLVHPIAALHGGWNNIFATGVKTDKNGAPAANSEAYCNYNKSSDFYKCDTTSGDCKGTDSPHSVVTPTRANVIYWDSLNKKCYRSQGTDKFSWIELNTTCPITRISVTSTSLVTAMTASDTTIKVSSTTGFPSGKNTLASLAGHSTSGGYIKIGSEIMYYTGRTSGTFTGVTRAQLSTTAAAHSSGEEVKYYPNGENFIFTATGAEEHVPTADGQYAYDASSKSCLYSKEKTGSPNHFYWSNQVLAAELGGTSDTYSPASVTLSWNSFMMTGSGSASTAQVLAWNVYRREANKEYDFKFGALKTNKTDIYSVSTASTKTFTDKTAIAGKVYYYTVRPVDNYYNTSSSFKFSTSTPEVFSEVRVYAPYANYGFVHRWMVNQEVCNGMHMTTSTTNKSDPTHNYRCPYRGPAEVLDNGSYYYDISEDMIVDLNETGCPYAAAPKCTSNGCIGIGAPSSTSGVVNNDMYYDRNSGVCYVYNGAWSPFNTAALPSGATLAKTNTALNAPLVNIDLSKATNICSSRSIASVTTNLTAPTSTLPSKVEYTAYSASPLGLSDSEVTDLEQGYSLNIQSRCNSTNASGLDSTYNDSSIPSTSLMFTIPGTASSNIRSLYTGSVPWGMSFSTQSCISKYGIQDVYGNVAEWVNDTMTCNAANFTCNATAGSFGNYSYAGTRYGFDFVTGPFNDSNTSGTVDGADSWLNSWDFRDELYGAGKFSFPIGMPINTDTPDATSLPYFLDIGPTSGITSNQLHEDGLNVDNISSIGAGTGGFVVGGSYLSGNKSGRFSSEMIPSTQTRSDIGLRCIIRVPKTSYSADSIHTYGY
jgi:hypothetical protein